MKPKQVSLTLLPETKNEKKLLTASLSFILKDYTAFLLKRTNISVPFVNEPDIETGEPDL